MKKRSLLKIKKLYSQEKESKVKQNLEFNLAKKLQMILILREILKINLLKTKVIINNKQILKNDY